MFPHFPLHITIVGDANAEDARDLWNVALRQNAPAKVVELLDPTRDAARLDALGYPPPINGAQAYVCVGQASLPPVTKPDALAAQLNG